MGGTNPGPDILISFAREPERRVPTEVFLPSPFFLWQQRWSQPSLHCEWSLHPFRRFQRLRRAPLSRVSSQHFCTPDEIMTGGRSMYQHSGSGPGYTAGAWVPIFTVALCLAVATAMVGLRTWSRIFITKRLGVDDWAAIITLVCCSRIMPLKSLLRSGRP